MLAAGHQLVPQGHRGGVALNARVKGRTHLGKACMELQNAAGMPTIAPSRNFTFGEGPTEHHPGDPRFYVILAWGEGLTRTHCDRGCQAVLYHTLEGSNQTLALTLIGYAALFKMVHNACLES